MDVTARVGQRLRSLRKRRGLTQEQLGERAGIAPKYLSSVERGLENPTVRLLAKAADALGVDVRDLFETNEQDQRKPAGRLALGVSDERELRGAKDELERARGALSGAVRVLGRLLE